MMKRILYLLLQLKALVVFRRRVYAHGNFKVGNSRNVRVGNGCSINQDVYILGRCDVRIGNRVVLSARSMLIDSGLDVASAGRRHTENFIELQDDCWIGAGAIVLPGVVVGRGSIVGAGSVLTRSIPPNCVAAGNPARIIRKLEESGRLSDAVGVAR